MISDPARMGAAEGSKPGHLMAAEIAEQPDVLARVLASSQSAVEEVAVRLRAAGPRFVLLAARGTSDHAALYAKYLVETRLGLPVGLVSTSTYTTYGGSPDLRDVLWVAVSQSGSSPDLVESTSVARARGAVTLAVTNAAESELAKTAELHLDLCAGPERSVAATKTYTASLLTLYLLVAAWGEQESSAAQRLPGLAADVLDLPEVDEVAARYRFVDKLVTTSRGFAYPTAREAALKLMETCYLSAHAFSGADLLHGPLAMIDADRPVVAIVPEGAGGQALAPVLKQLTDRGADLCVVSPAAPAKASAVLPLPSGIDEELAPIVQIIPLQQLALQMAVSRGHDPDRPRGLAKVTQTR